MVGPGVAPGGLPMVFGSLLVVLGLLLVVSPRGFLMVSWGSPCELLVISCWSSWSFSSESVWTSWGLYHCLRINAGRAGFEYLYSSLGYFSFGVVQGRGVLA